MIISERGRPSEAAASRSVSGTSSQHVLGGAHHDRDDDDGERHRAGPAGEVAHRRDHDLVDEQADDDRRRAQQDVVDEAHHRRQACRSGRIRPDRCRRECRSACRSGRRGRSCTRLPMIGLSRPPAAPGGGVISVKTRKREAAEALVEQRAEDQRQPAEAERGRGERQRHGDDVAAAAAGVERVASVIASPDPPLDAHQHVAGGGEHDEGDDEQDEAERDQRRGVDVADRFGEFVGDGRGDRRAGRQDRSRRSGARCR